MKNQICKGLFRKILSFTAVAGILFSLSSPAVPVRSAEPRAIKSQVVNFDAATDSQKFDFYSSSTGGFAVQDGKLVPTGSGGEFKAIYKDNDEVFQSVSVDLYPGVSGINGGLYINTSDATSGREQITGLGVMVQSNMSGWADAPNRVDLIICAFPGWTELQRTISETGAGNALFTGGTKQPLNLKVDISGNRLSVTLSLISNPSKRITTTYTYQGASDLGLGDVGIRSDFANGTFDNFTTVSQSDEVEAPAEPTDLVTFDTAQSSEKFDFYQSSNGGFQVQDGKLVPTGTAGEFKAIYKDQNASFQAVSVDIYPGQNGINGGLYLNLTDVGDAANQATGLVVMVESNMSGWADAVNRLDLVVGQFPQWRELHRTISETSNGNALFTGAKAPVNLTVEIQGNTLTITVKRLDNPARMISVTYVCAGFEQIALGNVGIRSQFNDASYDNFSVIYETVDADKEPDPVVPDPFEPTDLVDFETAESGEKFAFYQSSAGGFQIQDGKLVPTGPEGEFKVIYKDENASFEAISVDIYPGAEGINGGLYLDVTEVGHPENQITGLVVMVESNMSGWADAVNRADLVVGTFPQWRELHRTISETGNGNALFAGERVPVNLTVEIQDNTLTITLKRLDNPKQAVSVTYVCEGYTDIALGNVGIRSQRNTASYDNFAVIYTTVDEDKEIEVVEPERQPDVLVEFTEDTDAFAFYHSSTGGLTVADGQLKPMGETGEFKAIYQDGGKTIDAVSVDIYPGQDGTINSGIYIGTSTVEDGVDRIKGLVVMVESNMSGWDDAVNRIDIVVGRFPIWKELHRTISETGAGNALFTGAKEPVNLRVDLDGNRMTITLRLLSDPSKFVSVEYEYNGATPLPQYNVGLRSAFNDDCFDNFAVYTPESRIPNEEEN